MQRKQLYLQQTAASLILAAVMFISASSAYAESWRFAVLCDSRSSYTSDAFADKNNYYDATYGISPYFKNVAAALARETGVDFVLYPGDLVRGKKPALSDAQFATDLQEWLRQMNSSIPVYYIRGNHDAGNASSAWTSNIMIPPVNPVVQDAAQPGLTYSFTHKGSLFVGLDEYPNGAAGVTGYDGTFLKAQLAQKAQHKFVFAHQPIWNFKTSELGPSGLDADLNEGNVDVYFSGHVHSYQRIAKTGSRFQEMIIGTGGAPQDDPTLTGSDPMLTIKNYAGGTLANARFGYAIITVNDDGSITSEMKFLDDPTSANSTVSSFDKAALVSPRTSWKFGVMNDTQWTPSTDPTGSNPNGVSVSIINQINQQMIDKGVKFVIQVGDLTESGADADIAVRAAAAQALYDNGIGFFPMRGNHETYSTGNSFGIPAVQTNFPQTQCTGTHLFGASNCTSPTLPGSYPNDLKGMSYSFDFGDPRNGARVVVIDEWVTPNKSVSAAGYLYGYSITDQQDWITGRLNKDTRSTEHAFVFSHQNLMGENHQDTLFQGYADANPTMQNDFFASLQNNDVKYHISGHDHIHQRSIIMSPDGLSMEIGRAHV